MVFAVVVTLKSSRNEGFVDFSYFSSLTFWTSKITWFMPEYLYFKTLVNKDPFFFLSPVPAIRELLTTNF